MNIKDLKQLVKLMVDNDLNELEIADGESKVHLKRGVNGAIVMPESVAQIAAPANSPAPEAPQAETATAPPEIELPEIQSPMVGTFYTAPSPDAEPYVSVGAKISEGEVVCVVEAMKVMNEIKAECSGTIAEICVKNAQPVEFGQALFRVNPA